jgi:surface-anchored protein
MHITRPSKVVDQGALRRLVPTAGALLLGFAAFVGCGEAGDPPLPFDATMDGGDGGGGIAAAPSGGRGGAPGVNDHPGGAGGASGGESDGGATFASGGGAIDGGEGGALITATGGAFVADGAGGEGGNDEREMPAEGGAAGATAGEFGGSPGAAGDAGEQEHCDHGYRFFGGRCQDIDECASSSRNDCGEDRACVNTFGGYSCECGPGSSESPGGECVSLCAHRDFDGASTALSLGHVDAISAAYDAQARELRLFVSDDSFLLRQPEPVRRTPEDVLLHGNPAAELVVPDIPAFAGILEPGTALWVLPAGQPEAEAAGLIWPGLQAYGVSEGLLGGDRVLVRLLSHEGNGRFLGFASPQDEVTPPDLYFDPLNEDNEFALPAGVHMHMNWGFAQDGVHRLSFELEAVTLEGGLVRSEPQTYRFLLGELSALPPTERTIVVPEGLAESYASGAEMRLTAARYGMPTGLPAAWARQCADPSSGEPGPWQALGDGDELVTTAQAGCQYIACLMDDATVVAVSQPVSAFVE